MNYKIVYGNLLDADTKYIAHQCNSVTTKGSNLAEAVFERFPHSDIYTPRAKYNMEDLPLDEEKPGKIVIKGNGIDQRYVINMIGQWFPGGVKYPNSSKDGYIARQKYFKSCLKEILKINDLESIAFPYNIGCGVAGGDWDKYEQLIDLFAKYTDADVFLYKLEI